MPITCLPWFQVLPRDPAYVTRIKGEWMCSVPGGGLMVSDDRAKLEADAAEERALYEPLVGMTDEELRALSFERDRAYSAALQAHYKGRAGDMRYQTAEQPPHIRKLGREYSAASTMAHVAWQRGERASLENISV